MFKLRYMKENNNLKMRPKVLICKRVPYCREVPDCSIAAPFIGA